MTQTVTTDKETCVTLRRSQLRIIISVDPCFVTVFIKWDIKSIVFYPHNTVQIHYRLKCCLTL